MKIGILTHYNVYNMGAQLQLSAMRHYLEDLGHQPVVLTYEKNFDFLEGEKEKNSADAVQRTKGAGAAGRDDALCLCAL